LITNIFIPLFPEYFIVIDWWLVAGDCWTNWLVMQEISKKRTSSPEAAKENLMVQNYTSSTPLYFDTTESNILHIVIIVSTNCSQFLHNNTELFISYTTQTSIKVINGKLIVLFRHDLNSFCCEVLDNCIYQIGIPSHKVSVIIEE
jgi:hypothetical protein